MEDERSQTQGMHLPNYANAQITVQSNNSHTTICGLPSFPLFSPKLCLGSRIAGTKYYFGAIPIAYPTANKIKIACSCYPHTVALYNMLFICSFLSLLFVNFPYSSEKKNLNHFQYCLFNTVIIISSISGDASLSEKYLNCF